MDKLPKGWKWSTINEVCNKITDGTHKTPSYIDKGVPFLSVKDITKGYIDFSNTRFISVIEHNDLSKRCNPERNDILYTKVGTTGVAKVIDTDREFSLFVSLALLKPKKEIIESYFFEHLLNSPFCYEQSQAKTRGVANRNLVITDIKSIQIPLPPLPEQTRIVSKLDTLFVRIDKSIALLEENIKHTKGLMASVLEELFVNGKNWKREPLNKVAKVERGKSKHRPRNDQKLFGDSYPFIQTGDVRSANKYIDKYEVCYSEFGLKQSRLWNKGTICLTIAANIGDVAILGFEACFPDSVVGITPYSMNNEFLYYYLKTLQLQLDKKANSAAQKNINLKILSEIDVPVPSIEIQNSIADRFSRLEEKQFQILSVQQSKLNYLKALKSSLLDRAFKGDL